MPNPPSSYFLPTIPTFATNQAPAPYFRPSSPAAYDPQQRLHGHEIASYNRSPETTSHASYYNSGLPPLAVQLLIDTSAPPPSVAGVATNEGPASRHPGDGRLGSGVRLVQPSEFHLRAVALLGSPADWGEAGDSDWTAAPGVNGGDLARSPRFFLADPSITATLSLRKSGDFLPPYLNPYNRASTSPAVSYHRLHATFSPMQHRPTMFDTEMTAQVAFALAVAGAGLESDAGDFHSKMIKEQRIFAIHHLHELDLSDAERFSVLQSLSIYNFLALHHEDPQQQIYSSASHATLITTYRHHALPSEISRIDWTAPPLSASSYEIEASWREWIRLETLTRITFMVYLLDLTMTNTFGAIPAVNPSELALDLPSAEALWSAPTSGAWADLISLPQYATRPPCFLTVVDALLAQGSADLRLDPNRDRDRDQVLGQISSLSPFSLAILRETLARLEMGLRAKGANLDEIPEAGRDSPEVALRKVLCGTRVLELASGTAIPPGSWFKPVRPLFTNTSNPGLLKSTSKPVLEEEQSLKTQIKEAVTEKIRKASEGFPDGVTVETIVTFAKHHKKVVDLVDSCESHHCEIIVVGRRKRGPLQRFLGSGSVTTALLTNTNFSVLVVR
ncbi:hypothetical protein P7C70_g3726, partial [Phenoliferia sp. Uapishka_3]